MIDVSRSIVNIIMTMRIDSEREEGEIVDELDELSDISSEEEFLLRQRLLVLENYNNVLERKEAKRLSIQSGTPPKKETVRWISDLNASDFKIQKVPLKIKNRFTKHQQNELDGVKKCKCTVSPAKPEKRKVKRRKLKKPKKKVHIKTSESSDSENDEYRNKRRKLANAVEVNKTKTGISLTERLQRMIRGIENKEQKTHETQNEDAVSCANESKIEVDVGDCNDNEKQKPNNENLYFIDLSNDEEKNNVEKSSPDSSTKVEPENVVATDDKKTTDLPEVNSDEDLESLRQTALNTKMHKNNALKINMSFVAEKEADEDSDTAELRLICLKSTLLKKAIEIKQNQKIKKRLSQSVSLENFDDNVQNQESNNTDIESVDMEMGSDVEEKSKSMVVTDDKQHSNKMASNEIYVELEDDEDLLRAQLLTSLSKNLPHLINPSILEEKNVTDQLKPPVGDPQKLKPEEKFIINLGESDSEVEHEATKNLTKMHMKLSEQSDFQLKLDQFLKSTRTEIERRDLNDLQKLPIVNPGPKFVPKTVNYLPKSEQNEYNNLVKRMVELEKMKQARSISIETKRKQLAQQETTHVSLKPRNVTIETKKVDTKSLEEQIALSRKKIAEESSKLLDLKAGGKKLLQKFKIVSTELKNIKTAMTLNKKQQKIAQLNLEKIRSQHQRLLKSSTHLSQQTNATFVKNVALEKMMPKSQKENIAQHPFKTYLSQLQSVKVSVKNYLNAPTSNNLLVKVDTSNDKKTVTMPNTISADVSENVDKAKTVDGEQLRDEVLEKADNGNNPYDYQSPLQALGSTNWKEDPNGILCPFEVDGSCKDPDCKYLHPKTT